jgi:hypothetical protein
MNLSANFSRLNLVKWQDEPALNYPMPATAAKLAKKKSPAEKLNSPGEVASVHLDALDTGKQGYKTADSALDLLIAQCETDPCPECGSRRFKNDGIVKSPDGRRFRIVDKLATKLRDNVGMNYRRYELEEIPA